MSATISLEDAARNAKDDRATKIIDNDVRFDELLVENIHRMSPLEEVARRRGLLSPLSSRALGKAAQGNFNLSGSEKNALRHLFERLDEDGLGPGSW